MAPEVQRGIKKYVRGQIAVDTLLAFAFGVVFIAAMLIFAVGFPNPTPFQVRVFVSTLALAAAGIGAVIPGMMEIGYHGVFRAAGATALFAAVFFFQPQIASGVAQFEAPQAPARPVAEAYLSAIDDGALGRAASLHDPAVPTYPNMGDMKEIYENVRRPLGFVDQRKLVGAGQAQSPPPFPIGLYNYFNFLTKFAGSNGCRQESVVLRATSDLHWKVASHTISPLDVPCEGQAS